MNLGRTVFSQLISHLPDREFRRCVERYRGDYRLRGFSCWDQFLCMAFAQFTYRESLRDIEACLRSSPDKLYHMGIRGRVSRSTLADANETHDWRIFADFAQRLIAIARPLYVHDPIGVDLDQSLYALDSTTIDLCLSLFPWAKFRKHKAAVKMHTSARQYPHVYPHYRWQSTRREHPGRDHAGGWRVLCHGPRLHPILNAYLCLLSARRSSSYVAKRTSCCNGATPIQWTRRQDDCVLAAIARKRLGLESSLYQILQIFSVTIFEKVPILQLIEAFDSQSELLDNPNQPILFDL
jgi:Domain of unknown function (DUF4372)